MDIALEDRIRELHAQGYGATRVGRDCGLPPSTVYTYMRKLGLAPHGSAKQRAACQRNGRRHGFGGTGRANIHILTTEQAVAAGRDGGIKSGETRRRQSKKLPAR